MAHNATVNDDNIYDLSGEDGDGELAATMSVYRDKNIRPPLVEDSTPVVPVHKQSKNPMAVHGMPTSAQMADYYNTNGKLLFLSACI